MHPPCTCQVCAIRRLVWMLLMFVFSIMLTYSCDIQADTLIRRYVRISGFDFWSAKTDGLAGCARCCVRRRVCASFNFDVVSGLCELNSETMVTKPDSEIESSTSIYSSIDAWPSRLDPFCHERLCDMDEVCVPGSVADGTSCAHTCWKLPLRCPTPTTGTATSTTVGSVVNFTCSRGYVGGDTAKCLPTQRWSKELNTECIPDSGIRLVPEGGTAGRLEIFKDNEWVPVCYDDWDWKATHVICKEMFNTSYGGSFHTSIAFGEGTDNGYKFDKIKCSMSETSIYDCPNNKLKSCNNDKHMGITCFTQALDAGGVHIHLVDDESSTTGGSEGRLEIRYNGTWGTVCGKNTKWDNNGADVACKSLNSTWKTNKHCGNACQGEGTAEIMTSDVHCDGSEPSVLMCRNSGWGTLKSECVNNHKFDVGLTCRT